MAAVLLLTGTALGAVDLVRDGVPCADIVIADDPGPGILAAAQDLQKHVRRMTGAELKIVTPERSALPAKICVGESRLSREAGYRMPKFQSSGYDIWIRDSCIVLTGPVTLHRAPKERGKQVLSVAAGLNVPGEVNPPAPDPALGFSPADDLGPLYAVSAFLEDLGVRFYAPGPDGTIVPQKTTISVFDGRKTKEAAFAIREYRFGGPASAEDLLWLKRLKSGSASSSRIGVLSLADLMREGEKDHPDWAARGKRDERLLSHDLCCYPKYFHEGFRRACAERIRAIFDADAALEKLIVMPPGRGNLADNGEIGRMRLPGVFPQFPVQNIFFDFILHIDRELKKTHPGRRLVWMGPINDLPPGKDRMDKMTNELTAAPRPRAPHTYGSISGRKGYLKSLEKLNKTFHPNGMIQREWWNEFEFFRSPRLPFWFPKALQEVRRGQRENGVTGLLMDLTTGDAEFSGRVPETSLTHFMIYLNSKLLWDPDLDVDALLSEYCRLWFGPAGPEMRYLIHYGADILSRKGIRSVNHSKRSQLKFDDVPVIFQLLDRAKEKTEPGTLYRRRVEDLETCFAWLKEAFREPGPSEGKPITAQPFPCERTCSGDLSAYKNWVPLGDSAGPNRTEIALGVTDNRDRLLVAIRCFDDKMTDLPSSLVLLPDDPEIYKGDLFGIMLRSPLRGPFFMVVNPDGSFADSSSDPESLIQNGSFSGWSDDRTTVKVRRLADRWEAEIHFALGSSIGGPWPDTPSGTPWTLTLERFRRPRPVNGDRTATTREKYALKFPESDSEGRDVHARRLLPGARDQYVYGVKRASGPVPPDADWEGPEWKNVPELRLGINWHWYGMSGDFVPDARAKLQYDDKYIYVHYLVRDQYIKGEFRNDQDMVCLDSCMEFFVQPAKPGPYFNFECSCVGFLNLSRITENADGTKVFAPLKKEELAQIERFHTLRGPFVEEITQPTVWRLALRIPLDLFVRHANVQLPLTGQVWSANFFKCADRTSHPCWLMWKRAREFHAPEDFGKIIFE